MKHIIPSRLFVGLICSLLMLPELWAQQPTQPLDPGCFSVAVQDTMIQSAFINYGNGVRMKNNSRRMKLTIGQLVVGSTLEDDYNMEFGYWSGFLVAPFPPFVKASQGELLDRIQISWGPNPLGPFAVGGFKIYRDGVFLAQVDKSTRNYNDFNVIAGRPYNYEVRGINAYGEGSPGKALGFQVPNGVVTGWVRTINDSPVPNALVTLMPMQGYSAYFGPNDGAVAQADSATNLEYFPSTDTSWTLCFWIKTTEALNNPVMMDILPNPSNQGLMIKALAAGGMEISAGGSTMTGSFETNPTGWHHVTLTFHEGSYRMYLDGILKDIKSGVAILNGHLLRVGKRVNNANNWVGRLDELRIYHKNIDELDIPEIMEGTASSLTEGLKYYWKMDEQKGSKSFDVIQRTPFYFCGAVFDNDRPPVRTAGMTNEAGYYRIESANYGTGITFLAEPMKFFYEHRALKFTRSDMDYATLPDFAMAPKSTLETWVNSAGPDGIQTIISKRWNGSNSFQVQIQPMGITNHLIVKLNNQSHDFGLLGIGYHHLAFTIDSAGSSTKIRGFMDGVDLGEVAMPAYTGNWMDPAEPWVLGARKSGTDFVDHYGGLIDEIAVYDTILSPAKILEHSSNSRNAQEDGLRVYFAIDEGTGNRLNNSGSLLIQERGMCFGTEWTIMAPNQKTTPHVFAPATRQVTLNPSITSVDQVDFVDRSTIAVSGFVRYKNTDCFAKNIEILVNGESYSPAVFTDSTGKFILDLEPGATVTLTPKYEDHLFQPPSWDLNNVISPIAGIVFNDVTTRTISGVVAGGDCKLPILINPNAPSGTVCIVKVQSIDGCFEKLFQLGVTDGTGSVDGEYEFDNLPPIEFTVAVTEHSDPVIKTAFEVLGGKQVDLRTIKDTIVDFIYYAPPQVDIISGLDPIDPPFCNTIVLEQKSSYTVGIALKEFYLGEGCPLDTGTVRIINDVAGSIIDTTISNGKVFYKFTAGIVNPSPPFLQNIQFIGKSLSGNESSLTRQVLVTGLRSKANTFTTQLPEVPLMVLRDPPGDGSYSYLEKGQKSCRTISAEVAYETGGGGDLVIDINPEFYAVYAPLGFGTATPNGGGLVITVEGQASYQAINSKSFAVCTSFDERIQTSSADLIVGHSDSIPYMESYVMGGDIFVGGGLNVEFGYSDEVTFAADSCTGNVDVKLAVSPKNFATTFMYSDYHIRNNVMRYLLDIVNDPNVDQGKRDTCKQSLAMWDKILKDNYKQVREAPFRRNISFDGNFEYEYSETSDSSTSNSNYSSFNTEGSISVETGFEVSGAGISGSVKFFYGVTKGETTETGTEKGITTGFVLADDDPGDAFTIDIGMDTVYNTPVFRTVTGQSSCPWEPKTAHREGNSLEFRDGSSAVAVDIPSNEAAVYKFTLGNQGETNETWTYAFTAGPESNPHGAKIFLNGAPLDHPVMYAIPYGESIPITVTLERGPEEYDYDSLELVLYSLCEDERANALGILPDLDTILYSAVYISAHFIKPCSEVDINVPQQDWVVYPDPVTQGPDDVMRITVSGYDKSNAEFDKIRVQYRRSDGNGDWTNIVPPIDSLINLVQPGSEIIKDNLGATFTQFYWNTLGLADGPYEIRAIALCTGNASDKPGYSHVIKGRIERQPPSLIGVPEPADGVYNVGDEISFSFNKHINCSKINALDNVLLFDATTGLPIDIDITCYENKIILNPNFQNEFFENKILRAEIEDIEDLIGNKLIHEQWEFYVDRNELAWLTDSIGMTKYEDQSKTVTANIHNRGGYPVPFTIEDIPTYVHVVPNQGTLAPNEIRPISFTVDSSLAFGLWSDSITLHTEIGQNPFFMGGDERLPFGVRVVCRPPAWQLNGGLFENTENMVLELNIEGVVSTDVEDMVVAFIGDTLVGRANVQYVPQVNKYLAYLTIYGNPNHVLQPVRLEIWDASECLRYAVLEDYYLFQPDDVIGDPLNPQVIHTFNLVLREVPLGFGWNWLSFNLGFPDPEINAALASLSHPQNDLMKSQNQFSTYFNGGGWLGTLQYLGNTSMYVYRANIADTLMMLGTVLDPATTPIQVVPGWNWISYIPNYSLPVNEALSSIPAQTGDLIKSQISFAQYINPTFGWIGNLGYMSPPNGYQLKVSAPGTLIYPPLSNHLTNGSPDYSGKPGSGDRGPGEGSGQNLWNVDPTQFEHSMTLIGMLKVNEQNATSATMELGAFAGAQVRGSSQAIFIPPLQSYLFFLTVYANSSGEQIRYQLFDSSTGSVQELNELMYFSPELHQGSIDAPVPFTLLTSGTQEALAVQSFDVQPNPFHQETNLRFALTKAQEVRISITDMGGRQVAALSTFAKEGMNSLPWKAQSDSGANLAKGVYFIRLQTETGSVVKKIVMQ